MNIVYIYRDWWERRSLYGHILTDMGHTVTNIQIELHPERRETLTINHVKESDLILYSDNGTYGLTMYEDLLHQIKNNNIRLVYYGEIGLPIGEAVKVFEPFDWVFVKNMQKAQELRDYSHSDKYIFMPMGFYAHQYFPCPIIPKPNKDINVSFAGDILSRIPEEYDTRAYYLRAMLASVPNTKVYGSRICKRVGAKKRKYKTHEDQRGIYWRSKINLDLPFINEVWQQNMIHCKNRFFEIPACKEILLTAHSREFDTLLKSEKEAFYYTTAEDMVDKAKWILENYNNLEEVRKAAYNRCIKEHQYKYRFKKIMEIIK